MNTAVGRGVAYLHTQQNSDGSFGTAFPDAETALALASYDVADGGDVNNLSSALRGSLLAGLRFLLAQQTSTGQVSTDYPTYTTGLSLIALALMGPVAGENSAIARAIHRGRQFLISGQQAPPSVTGVSTSPVCQTTGALGTGLGGQDFCGGWTYDPGPGRSDESNTGFALTGLQVSGGVPSPTAAIDLGWQRNVQEVSGNPFATRDDGGGDYQPGQSGDFSSNANDTGSLLFGYAYDGLPATDPGVRAAIAFAHAVLDEYERVKQTTPRVMVFHTGQRLDGTCDPSNSSCDWAFAGGEGGYHYSMFALSKALSQYETASLSDPSNFYAQVVDLLLSEQNHDGSWPADLRDDASVVGATSFAVLALGQVGAPPPPVLGKSVDVVPVSGQVFVKLPAHKALDLAGGPQASAAVSKGRGFVPLTAARQLPSGSEIDARAGTLSLTAAAPVRHGKLQTGVFGGGLFKATQSGSGLEKGLTTLSLVEGAFPGAPSFRSCGTHGAQDGPRAVAAKTNPRVLQALHAQVHGNFRTKGKDSSATARGTQWGMRDRCDGTLTVVQRGTVAVFDFRLRKTILVHAGHQYLAKAR